MRNKVHSQRISWLRGYALYMARLRPQQLKHVDINDIAVLSTTLPVIGCFFKYDGMELRKAETD